MAVDLEPVKQVMHGYMGKFVLLGAVIIAGNLLFKKLERYMKRKKR